MVDHVVFAIGRFFLETLQVCNNSFIRETVTHSYVLIGHMENKVLGRDKFGNLKA